MSSSRNEIILLSLVSLLLVTLFSACSWLYPLNPWDDANCFTTIAKSMNHGAVLYRDVFDQKGPLLFIVHALSDAALARPFLGIYLLEVVCLAITLVFGLKMLRLFSGRYNGQSHLDIWLVAGMGLLYIASDFYYYGDTVEEFSLPALTYGLYILLAYARDNRVPTAMASFLLGVGCAWVFWMKFTVLAMLGGGFFVVLYLATVRRQWKEIGPAIGWIFGGFFAASALVLLYFVPTHSVADVFEGYFGYNLFHYHLYSEDTESEMGFFPLRWLAFAILMVPCFVVKCRRDVRIMVVTCWAFALILMVVTTVYIYYFLVVFAFVPLYLALILRWWKPRTIRIVLAVVSVLMVLGNFNLVQLCRGNFPQAVLRIAKTLENEPEDTGVLCYHSRETGLYTYSRFVAPVKGFFMLSVVHQDYLDEQEDYVNSPDCRYVITKDAPFSHPDYTLVKEERELFRTLIFIRPKIWLYNQTGLSFLRPAAEVENAIPTVANATYSCFRLYRRKR